MSGHLHTILISVVLSVIVGVVVVVCVRVSYATIVGCEPPMWLSPLLAISCIVLTSMVCANKLGR